ncbi:glyoxalase [Sphaerisporangium album]|uniref:Glyoxalase n=1 Tax=Sphaerisporangium album TaxID=509200 RepID=A0A367FMX5_9ACTN|nr:VOC family protein [Sphaerisporangium album]RCG31259.1 glyoxalase [Sphaerisporangium album]
MIVGLHHVQLAAPPGSEPRLRAFYAAVLGLTEVPKPARLAARGGVWFRGPGVELHLGIEEDFRPARRAHPGLLVDDLPGLVARLGAAGIEARPDGLLPGFRRCYVDDPVGNRIEFLEPAAPFDEGR